MKLRSILVILPLIALVAAQAQTSPGVTSTPGKTSKSKAAVAMPLVEGEVERVDRERNEVILHHGELPNLGMPPMTMAFNVADKRMLDRLKRGDKVRFNAEIIKGEATVTYIEAAPQRR